MDLTKSLQDYETQTGTSDAIVREFVQYCNENNVLLGGANQKKYNVIVMDPPWPYTSRRMVQDGGKKMAGIDDEYSTMSIDDMAKLPMQNVCAKNCLLFMWVTGPKLEEAFKLIRAWNFKYSTVAFVWDKRVPNPGFYSMSQCEYVLVAKQGKAPSRNKGTNVRQFFSQTRTTHSTKPEEIQDMIEAQFDMKNINKVEIFARRFRKGWDCVGNELNGTIQDFLSGKKMKLRAPKGQASKLKGGMDDMDEEPDDGPQDLIDEWIRIYRRLIDDPSKQEFLEEDIGDLGGNGEVTSVKDFMELALLRYYAGRTFDLKEEIYSTIRMILESTYDELEHAQFRELRDRDLDVHDDYENKMQNDLWILDHIVLPNMHKQKNELREDLQRTRNYYQSEGNVQLDIRDMATIGVMNNAQEEARGIEEIQTKQARLDEQIGHIRRMERTRRRMANQIRRNLEIINQQTSQQDTPSPAKQFRLS
jgi:N6-adenosine-specific RNA methylase IME4